MAGEGQFRPRVEDTHPVIGVGTRRGQQKCRFAEICPIREGCHFGVEQPVRADNDGERIAFKGLPTKNIDLPKRVLCHDANLQGRKLQLRKSQWSGTYAALSRRVGLIRTSAEMPRVS